MIQQQLGQLESLVRTDPPCIVVQDGAVLPSRCVKTNEPVDGGGVVKRLSCVKSSWHDFTGPSFLLNLVLLYCYSRESSTLTYFLSPEVRWRYFRRRLFSASLLFGCVACWYAAIVLDSGTWVFIGVALLVAGVVAVLRFCCPVRVIRWHNGEFWIKGCSPAFVESLEHELRVTAQ